MIDKRGQRIARDVVSERQLRRGFKRRSGTGPKTLARGCAFAASWMPCDAGCTDIAALGWTRAIPTSPPDPRTARLAGLTPDGFIRARDIAASPG